MSNTLIFIGCYLDVSTSLDMTRCGVLDMTGCGALDMTGCGALDMTGCGALDMTGGQDLSSGFGLTSSQDFIASYASLEP